jgi:hypothetical protein
MKTHEGVVVDEHLDLRSAVSSAFDAGIEARNHVRMLTAEPPRWRWIDFVLLFGVQSKVAARAEATASSLQAESAAFACQRFAERLEQTLRVFPDVALADAAQPSRGWKDRVWDAADEAGDVAGEVNAALDVVSDLHSQLNRGHVPQATAPRAVTEPTTRDQ